MSDSHHVVSVPSHDPVMEAAIVQAKQNIGVFFNALSHPTSSQTSFLVKIAYDVGDTYEHIWLADLDFSGDTPKGVVANEPKTNLIKFKQVIEFQLMYISDWMYIDSGVLVGGYTTRALRDRLTSTERKEFDQRFSYKFE